MVQKKVASRYKERTKLVLLTNDVQLNETKQNDDCPCVKMAATYHIIIIVLTKEPNPLSVALLF